MVKPLTVIAESDPALRGLMRKVLEPLGYDVLEAASSEQLAVLLRSRTVLQASCLFLVMAASLALPCQAGISTLGRERAGASLPVPHAVVTLEFGTARDATEPSFTPCVAAGNLEKPFDVGLLQSIASHCRTYSAAAEASPTTKG